MFARHLVSAHQAQLLEEHARAMRFQPTRSEERLWRSLSGSKTGFAFRRQLVIGPYIADFACTKVRLVVEVDGASHEQRGLHDAQRDRALAALGWSVLRIPEHMVFEDLAYAIALIVARATELRG
jgi:very-short-patch-repair endonuclease